MAAPLSKVEKNNELAKEQKERDLEKAELEDELKLYHTTTFNKLQSIRSRRQQGAVDGSNIDLVRSVSGALTYALNDIPSGMKDLDEDEGLRRTTTDHAKKEIGWESEDDPENPINWSVKRKWAAVGVVSGVTFFGPLGSSVFAPAVGGVLQEYQSSSSTIATLIVTLFVLGFAAGPIFLAPLSEIYGRAIVIQLSNIVLLAFNLGCGGATSIPMLMVFRFLAGLGGSAALTIGGGVIADVFEPAYRGKATAIFSLGPLLGPVVGPIAGGFIEQTLGWRWVFWILSIFTGVVVVATFIFLKETNPAVILERKTQKIRKESGDHSYRSALSHGLTKTDQLKHGLVRPIKMLFLSPIVLFLSLYMSFIYGVLYLAFTSVAAVFRNQYGFTVGTAGLAYLGVGFGFMFGLFIVGKYSDVLLEYLTKKNNGVREPEMRLPFLFVSNILMAVSLFWYGWSLQAKVHWIFPIIGLAPFGIGILSGFLPIQTYLIDANGIYAASAVAAATILRSIFGAFLPLAGTPLYASLDYGWGNSLLGFICLAAIPLPIIFYKYGKVIREKYTPNLD